MTKNKLDEVRVIVLCIVIAFFLMMSIKANAQHILIHSIDTVKYEYFDLKDRKVSNSFLYEKNMGWRMWMIADDGVIRKRVFIDTVINK